MTKELKWQQNFNRSNTIITLHKRIVDYDNYEQILLAFFFPGVSSQPRLSPGHTQHLERQHPLQPSDASELHRALHRGTVDVASLPCPARTRRAVAVEVKTLLVSNVMRCSVIMKDHLIHSHVLVVRTVSQLLYGALGKGKLTISYAKIRLAHHFPSLPDIYKTPYVPPY